MIHKERKDVNTFFAKSIRPIQRIWKYDVRKKFFCGKTKEKPYYVVKGERISAMFFRKCCGGKILGFISMGIGLLLILTVMPYWFWIVFIGIGLIALGWFIIIKC
ncbi:MAG: hypothetical protein DBX46_03785 [Clostridiales bacterium]|nr:MAG: hypothetical protein DBX46_03785 [Clostridiales bacterium]